MRYIHCAKPTVPPLTVMLHVVRLAQAAARRFASNFIDKYAGGVPDAAPRFVERGLPEVLQGSVTDSSFVFAYFHSDLNQDADEFCRHGNY